MPIYLVSSNTDIYELTELGNVPDPSLTPYGDGLDEIGNVDLPPEYGIDIIIRKGTVKYGPWADRQR